MNETPDYPLTEEEYGKAMKALCKKEGHRPRLPPTVNYGAPVPSEHHSALLDYFRASEGAITTSALAKQSGVPIDTTRDLCKAYRKQGWLQGAKNYRGYHWQVLKDACVPDLANAPCVYQI